MIEFLTMELLWWHWVVLGLILITFEMFSGTFFMLGLGVSAMLVGAFDKIFSLSLETEIILWLILSVISITLWFKYLKDNTIEYSGQSNYSLDTEGVVVEDIKPNGRGKVKFDQPLLGSTLWYAKSEEELLIGSRIKIVEIRGQLIEVETTN